MLSQLNSGDIEYIGNILAQLFGLLGEQNIDNMQERAFYLGDVG